MIKFRYDQKTLEDTFGKVHFTDSPSSPVQINIINYYYDNSQAARLDTDSTQPIGDSIWRVLK